MNELNKEYVKSISNNLVAILSNLYHDVLIERVTEKYKAEELNLARKELDEIISLFKSKITKQCKPKIENCLNYAISKYLY